MVLKEKMTMEMEVTQAPYHKVIYIGSGHSPAVMCSQSGICHYIKVCMQFDTRRGAPLRLTVKICPVCGAVFLPYKKYEKHWVRLGFYNFIRAKDGKMPSEERIKRSDHKPDPNYVPPKIDYHEIYKTPDYIVRGLRRPLCGGGMSPR